VPDPNDRPPRTGIDRFLWGSGIPGEGFPAAYWGFTLFVAVAATVVTLRDGAWWWSILFIPVAVWAFRRTMKAVRARNF
jgi:hypothetical protein